uniref:Uncharacterized protein n=1 Tax=Chromera velia CCMP2878 TaxID=1169474 RepID=A0A0G4HDQ3_9ALVE|eukprot:Cvel_26463.t1-p1 / transcript=Cvel_26463.t1 / gene=Cvel_26463 / organism=Chromera_velia_CCMP2878 / gene_product=hypothetical protein / transcript_product=hypothetical protein / location=Cvel_scaffold3148:1285-7256(+) / protein_length=834 / sequence_SO=supercontig / SO=protein_coding / is_pseudo=false
MAATGPSPNDSSPVKQGRSLTLLRWVRRSFARLVKAAGATDVLRLLVELRLWLLAFVAVRVLSRFFSRALKESAWKAKKAPYIVQAALYTTENLQSLGRVEKRTLFERDISEVFPNVIVRSQIEAAARMTTREKPFLMPHFPVGDRWHVLTGVLNQLSALFAPHHLFFDQRGRDKRIHYKSSWYVFTMTYHRFQGAGRYFITPFHRLPPGADVAASKIRIMLVCEQSLRDISLGTLHPPRKFFTARHEHRFRLVEQLRLLYMRQFSPSHPFLKQVRRHKVDETALHTHSGRVTDSLEREAGLEKESARRGGEGEREKDQSRARGRASTSPPRAPFASSAAGGIQGGVGFVAKWASGIPLLPSSGRAKGPASSSFPLLRPHFSDDTADAKRRKDKERGGRSSDELPLESERQFEDLEGSSSASPGIPEGEDEENLGAEGAAVIRVLTPADAPQGSLLPLSVTEEEEEEEEMEIHQRVALSESPTEEEEGDGKGFYRGREAVGDTPGTTSIHSGAPSEDAWGGMPGHSASIRPVSSTPGPFNPNGSRTGSAASSSSSSSTAAGVLFGSKGSRSPSSQPVPFSSGQAVEVPTQTLKLRPPKWIAKARESSRGHTLNMGRMGMDLDADGDSGGGGAGGHHQGAVSGRGGGGTIYIKSPSGGRLSVQSPPSMAMHLHGDGKYRLDFPEEDLNNHFNESGGLGGGQLANIPHSSSWVGPVGWTATDSMALHGAPGAGGLGIPLPLPELQALWNRCKLVHAAGAVLNLCGTVGGLFPVSVRKAWAFAMGLPWVDSEEDAGMEDGCCLRMHIPVPTLKSIVDEEELREMRSRDEYVVYRCGE